MASREGSLDSLIQKHPLQRLASPSRRFSAVIHFLGLASFAYSFKYLVDNPNPINQSYGWHFQYLTILGLSLASLTFISAFVADVTASQRLFLVKNALSVCSAPLEVLISILYWGLSAIDRSLVVPPDLLLPLSADVGFHLFPSVFLTLDLLLLSPPWTITALPSFGLAGVIAFGYWFWIEFCYSHNGFYPYPLFELLNTTQRIGLFALSATLMGASTVFLKEGYRRINGEEKPGKVKG